MSISPMEVEGVNINSDDRGLKNNNTFRCGLHGRLLPTTLTNTVDAHHQRR